MRAIVPAARQADVFALLIQGKSNAEIAQALSLAEKTIKSYVTAVLRDKECKSRAQLIARHYLGLLT